MVGERGLVSGHVVYVVSGLVVGDGGRQTERWLEMVGGKPAWCL